MSNTVDDVLSTLDTENLPKNIILIGFMGAGKTTLGKALADRLGYTFLDTDQMIEKQEGKSITELVSNKGMPYFRNCEKQLCKTLPTLEKHIIATGGGLPIDPDNKKWLQQTGKVYFLDVPFETIWERVSTDTTRPLVKTKTELLALYNERLTLYKSY